MAATRRLNELGDSILARARPHLPEGAVAVALSGGADSAACAWVAQRAGCAPLRAIHVHHGLAPSDLLAEAAEAVADELGIACDRVDAEVPAGPSPEGQARTARYAALEAAARPGEWVLTAHTRDDQAETVLGNLLRGAGAGGLTGIGERGRFRRPLLDVSRSETRELAALAGLPFRDDPANEEDYRRNELRRSVMPDLEARFNPRLREALARTAGQVAADDAVLEAAAARVPVRLAGGGLALPAPLLVTLPPPVAARAVRAALRTRRPPHAGTAGEVEAVLAVAAGEAPKAGLGGGLEAVREGPWVVVGPDLACPAGPVPMPLPGAARAGPVTVTAWIELDPPRPWPLGTATAILDADTVGPDAELRPAAPGERVAIAGGSKPVRDALAEAGIPARMRPGWPVVAARGKLVWVVGARVAGWAGPGPGTRRYLWLAYEMEDR